MLHGRVKFARPLMKTYTHWRLNGKDRFILRNYLLQSDQRTIHMSSSWDVKIILDQILHCTGAY